MSCEINLGQQDKPSEWSPFQSAFKFRFFKNNSLPCWDLNSQLPWYLVDVLQIELSRLGFLFSFNFTFLIFITLNQVQRPHSSGKFRATLIPKLSIYTNAPIKTARKLLQFRINYRTVSEYRIVKKIAPNYYPDIQPEFQKMVLDYFPLQLISR